MDSDAGGSPIGTRHKPHQGHYVRFAANGILPAQKE